MIKKEKTQKKVAKAIYDFKMIEDGDKVIVGISGGKDSMFLAYILNKVKKVIKNKFEIIPIHLCFEGDKDEIYFEKLKKYFKESLNLKLEKIVITLPKDSKLNKGIKESCQRCSYSRRITLLKLAKKYGASKIALGHHIDDIVVTAFMNMISGRKLQIMPPVNMMSKGDITFIRPLSYLREKSIISYVEKNNIVFSKKKCPLGDNKMRNTIKEKIIWENEKILKNYTENIFWALIKDFKEKNNI